MLLKEHLTQFSKKELLDLARGVEIRRYSGLRKAELIDRIVESLCSEELMRTSFVCLTKEELDLFRKLSVAPRQLSIHETMDGIQLYRYLMGSFEEPADQFCVFEDVAEAFRKIDDEEFRAEQFKKGWMVKCVRFFAQYHGVAPIEVIYKMYRQRVKCTIDEMMELLYEMPIDIIESCIIPMDELGMQDWPKDDPLYSDKGIFVYIPLLEEDEFDGLLERQMDKDFFIPTKQQIDEICQFSYEESSPVYKKLESFFMVKLDLPYEQAVSWCLQVWANSYEGESPTELFDSMSEANIIPDGEEMARELMDLFMSAHNNTRLRVNRGFKPNELEKNRKLSGRMPTVVQVSSHASEILKEAAPQLQAMGMPVNLDGDSDIIQTTTFPNGLNGKAVRSEKKIYPNDPCPCGSGKKYKKCCGRHN